MNRGSLRVFPALLRVGFADAVAYRAEFLIWILATNMPLVMLALWHAVAREHPIGQFGQREFVAYFLSALIVRLLTGSWVVWELNYELRQGTLAFRLLRPVHPMVHYAAENLAAIPIRSLFALPIELASLYAMGLDQVTHDPVLGVVAVVATFGAWLLTFAAMATIGVLGFYVENSLAIFQVWFGLYMLLSGYLVPLALLPKWLNAITSVLPFRFMLGFPVEVIIGRVGRTEGLELLGAQWLYIGLFLALLGWAWNAGMRRFNAYGG